MRSPALAQVESIAVLRANGMGDYLMSEPALTALRTAAPQAAITLLGGEFAAAALVGRPGPVDEVVLVPYTPGLREPPVGQGYGSWDALRERHFDLALQLHGGGRNSSPALLGLKAGFTAGFRVFDAPALDLDLPYQFWQHEVFRHLDAVAALGAAARRVSPRFTVLESDLLASRGLVEEPFVVIHPGATDPRRRWPADRFAAVADALAVRGAAVVVVGSGEEVEPVVAASRSARGLPETGVPALVGLLSRARLLVGNDSGPRHLAEALGTPTVSVYWFGNMINYGPVSRRGHRTHISWTTTCPQCGRPLVGEPFPPRCCDNVCCVSDVPVEAVMSTVDELYEAASPRQLKG